jgi:hypothetical protein
MSLVPLRRIVSVPIAPLPKSEIDSARGGGVGIVFPIVLIPAYSVPRAFLIHLSSLIGLLRRTSP